jgi:hypothetical protein
MYSWVTKPEYSSNVSGTTSQYWVNRIAMALLLNFAAAIEPFIFG